MFKVEYITIPGWQTSTECIRDFKELPVQAQKYVEQIEEIIGVPGES